MAEETEKLHVEDKEQEENTNWVKSIQEITGYEFHDPSLLQQAFTHPSYDEGCSSSLDRLAYLGDSVLNLLITQEHYALYQDLDPGKLTRLRASNVDTEKLARVAVKYGLHKFLRHNLLLLAVQIDEFKEAIKDYPLHSNGLIDTPKVLADIFESFFGAIYIDSNCSMDTTWKIAKNLLEPMITPATLITHPVTQLQEMCQKKGLPMKIVDLWKETGEFEYVIAEKFIGRAKYTAKRNVAKNKAALNAYYEIIQELDF
ncbi:Ribonuclease III [Handroanthus impetiginosus]|uniref:Ribonuclease III n=1 Tax=Handroanthus impetiginosus TaxID=429701 RepID=A0A2G9HUH6_9LAMI|nr:Ribonuclease III [Handroanthus impetiginosus]